MLIVTDLCISFGLRLHWWQMIKSFNNFWIRSYKSSNWILLVSSTLQLCWGVLHKTCKIASSDSFVWTNNIVTIQVQVRVQSLIPKSCSKVQFQSPIPKSNSKVQSPDLEWLYSAVPPTTHPPPPPHKLFSATTGCPGKNAPLL